MNRFWKSIGRRFGFALAGLALTGGVAGAATQVVLVEETLFTQGSNWNFLHISNNVDPAVADTDFNDTWFKNDGSYNGPAFAGPSAAPFSYGGVDALIGGTVLAPTPASGSRKTDYFTTSFNFGGNPAAVATLAASLLADDGAFIYLNGQRVGALNMGSATEDTFNTLAGNGSTTGSETAFTAVPLTNALVNGVNFLAISVHNQAVGSSDLGFDISLRSVTNPVDALDLTNILPMNSVWRYLDDGSDQGTAWHQVGFDNSAWASGNAELGYGDGGEATVVNSIDTDPIAEGIQRNITTYFSTTFNIENPNQIEQMVLSLLRDDGAVVYLNGVEILRDGMPLDGDILFTTLATQTVGDAAESTKFQWMLSPEDLDLLVAGENVISVEIHQVNATSSDISFDLQLDAVVVVPLPAAGWAGLAALSAMGLGRLRRNRA